VVRSQCGFALPVSQGGRWVVSAYYGLKDKTPETGVLLISLALLSETIESTGYQNPIILYTFHV
jgi:hypothetical protein